MDMIPLSESASATGLSSSRSALLCKGSSASPAASFAQQFNYHLQDLAILRRNQTAKPDGQLTVHLPNLQSVKVDYNRRETIEKFRERLQAEVPDLRISSHYVVSSHGLIADGQTLDEYFLTPGADLLIIPKGVRNKQHLMGQRFWIKSRQYADRGEPRPSTVTAAVTWKAHRITPYRTSKEALKFARAHQ
jgi:hypothetical protein